LPGGEPADLEGHGGVPGQRSGQGHRRFKFGPEDLESLLPACEKPLVNQIRWFIGLDPSDTVQKCAEHDIVVEAYSPFAHGLIVNHPEIGDIAARYGVSAPQLCIRYLLQKGAVVLPKATKTPHIKQKDAMEFRWKGPIAGLVPALSYPAGSAGDRPSA
jgi:hypothetical protein